MAAPATTIGTGKGHEYNLGQLVVSVVVKMPAQVQQQLVFMQQQAPKLGKLYQNFARGGAAFIAAFGAVALLFGAGQGFRTVLGVLWDVFGLISDLLFVKFAPILLPALEKLINWATDLSSDIEHTGIAEFLIGAISDGISAGGTALYDYLKTVDWGPVGANFAASVTKFATDHPIAFVASIAGLLIGGPALAAFLAILGEATQRYFNDHPYIFLGLGGAILQGMISALNGDPAPLIVLGAKIGLRIWEGLKNLYNVGAWIVGGILSGFGQLTSMFINLGQVLLVTIVNGILRFLKSLPVIGGAFSGFHEMEQPRLDQSWAFPGTRFTETGQWSL